MLRQRDTYFGRARGRLKLREQEPGGAQLIAYERPDDEQARTSAYRLADVADPDAVREALDAALGTRVVVDKRRHLLTYENVRIHLDEVEGLGAFVELEGVAAADSDLTRERELIERLTGELQLGEPIAVSYSDLLLDEPQALLAAADAVMRTAHAPYSQFKVGAALRADDGSIHSAANVETSAYPQGQCAEASASGAMVAAGRSRIVEAAVIASADEPCVPCGGCRQRLREFMPAGGRVHLCSAAGERRTVTLEELLPLSFGPEHLPA